MKKQLTTRIDADTRDRLDATVIGIKRLDPNYTLAQCVTDAVAEQCARLEAAYNDGQPWQPSSVRLPPGRPIGG